MLSGIVGPALEPWRARRKKKAEIILAEGRADISQLEAETRAKVREILVPPVAANQIELDVFQQVIAQGIQLQEAKRLRNRSAVAQQAIQELGDAEVPDHEPDHDWTARFFNYVQDISSEEAQSLWAKVLAGEVERPGSTSIRTLSILRNLDQASARLFRRLCSVCVSLSPSGGRLFGVRAPSLGGDAGQNALIRYGLGFGDLNVLNEYGLIISGYNSWRDYSMSIGLYPSQPKPDKPLFVVPLGFQGRYWVLSPTTERHPVDKEFGLSGVALTLAGQELAKIVDLEPMVDYTQALMEFFQKQSLQMTEVDSPLPIKLS